MRVVTPLLLAALLLPGCGDRDLFAPSDVGVLVVDAVLIVDEPLPEIYLSRTIPPQSQLGLEPPEGILATVTITRQDGVVIRYSMDGQLPGRYFPYPEDQQLVAPSTRYDLRVETIREEILRASTLTPARLDEVAWLLLEDDGQTLDRELEPFDGGSDPFQAPANQLVYRDGLLEAQVRTDESVGYQVLLESLDDGSPLVIDPDFFEEDDFDDLERINTSPMFDAADGQVRLPWFAIFYAGRHLVTLYSVDRNWDDLVRSTPELSEGGPGFGGNLGDNFERPIFHVEGGIGLFGSAVRERLGFVIYDDD